MDIDMHCWRMLLFHFLISCSAFSYNDILCYYIRELVREGLNIFPSNRCLVLLQDTQESKKRSWSKFHCVHVTLSAMTALSFHYLSIFWHYHQNKGDRQTGWERVLQWEKKNCFFFLKLSILTERKILWVVNDRLRWRRWKVKKRGAAEGGEGT